MVRDYTVPGPAIFPQAEGPLKLTAHMSPLRPRPRVLAHRLAGTIGLSWIRTRMGDGIDQKNKERNMSIGFIVLIVLILILIGALPTWPHSRNWGYYPSGGIGLIVVILLILLLMGRL